ncbi:hypothetical protein J6590_074429 [Homalodisca vitripennis]|nr:hypothetical protein J6590_074429 [Homalodisca vitripennis]
MFLIIVDTFWLIPELLTWYISRKFNIDIRIGQIGVFYFKLKDVVIYKNGFTIHIDKISFRSSFLSSEVAKLLSVVVHDVRINKDVRSKRSGQPRPWQPPPSFHNQRIPPTVITFAQFMAVDIHSVTGMFLWTDSPEWLLHMTLTDIHIDGSILHSSRSLLVNITVRSSSAKLLRHAADACLAELSVALAAEATFVAQGPLSLEEVYVGLEHTKAVINDGFYSFVQERHKPEPLSSKPDVAIIVQRLAPIIPKLLTLKLEDALLQDMATLQLFQLKTKFAPAIPPASWPQLAVELKINGFHVSKDTSRLLTLNKLSFDAEVMEKVIIVQFSLKNLLASYDHENVYSWLLTHLHQPQDFQEVEGEEEVSDWEWLQGVELKGKVELLNVTTILRLSQTTVDAVSGFNHLKVVCTCDPSSVNAERHKYTAELLMESAWCRLNSGQDAPPGKSHIWGTPLYLGVTLVNLRRPLTGPARLQGMLDIVRVEWSPPLASFLAHAASCVKDYQCLRNVQQSSRSSTAVNIHIDTTINITNTNAFLIADKKVCIVVRLDKMLVDSRQAKLSITLEGAKIMSISPTKAQYTCLRSEEIKVSRKLRWPERVTSCPCRVCSSSAPGAGPRVVCALGFGTNTRKLHPSRATAQLTLRQYESSCRMPSSLIHRPAHHFRMTSMLVTHSECVKQHFPCFSSNGVNAACGHVKMVRAEWHKQDNMWLVELTEEVDTVWSPNLHLKLLTLFKEMKALRNTLVSPDRETVVSERSSVPESPPRKLQVKVKARLRCNLILSSKHNLTFTTDDIAYLYAKDNCLLETSLLKIAVDGATIFTFENLEVKRLHDSEVVKGERANSDGFLLAWNNTWGVSIKSLKMIFPYEHNFTDAVQKEFISIVKWLRSLYRKQKPTNDVQPLPSDLVIKLKEFVFEMSDDPFEVRLRDNYELLEDEYKEILKRQKMLDAKVADMCKTRRLLPAGKVEELYQNFNKLNSQIYLQRSRQMKQAGTRTRLFAWIMSEVEIIALADPSIHGAENVVKVMTEIDCDTPWPEEGVEFSTLWCRSVTASCVEWKFQLRDFPQPWLDIGQLHMWGRLVGAEQMATRRGQSTVVVVISSSQSCRPEKPGSS